MTQFLRKEWIAVALSNAKNEILGEDVVTISELQQFSQFLQKYFNNEKLDIVIPFGLPDSDGFKVNNGIIVVPKSWNLSVLPDEIQKILFDSDLLIDFFIELENKKLDILTGAKGKRKKLVIDDK
ncbi:MAG: hypothetical protein HFI87_06385 [Bacilli bacterium]|nr:hypothetical protein [Bacilli bacterium]